MKAQEKLLLLNEIYEKAKQRFSDGKEIGLDGKNVSSKIGLEIEYFKDYEDSSTLSFVVEGSITPPSVQIMLHSRFTYSASSSSVMTESIANNVSFSDNIWIFVDSKKECRVQFSGDDFYYKNQNNILSKYNKLEVKLLDYTIDDVLEICFDFIIYFCKHSLLVKDFELS